MDVKQRLSEYADACRQRIPYHSENAGQLALDARAEIERLERLAATTVDLTNALVTCKRERDALTDRMIAAGLMA